MAEGAETGVGAKGGSSPIFVKGFLPGLLVGLVVGLTLGAVVPPLLDSPALEVPDEGALEPSETPTRRERERDGAFEGTGLPLDSEVGEDASDTGVSTPPTPE